MSSVSNVKSAETCRNDYVKRKNQIIALLDQAIAFYEGETEESKAATFRSLREDLENGEFSIVVVGEFSAGKSTLLNALMCKRILPSFTNETTATVNFLRHAEKSVSGEAGTVFYNDGRKENISDLSMEIINRYVSTKGDDVANTVKHLDLYLDSDFLKDGVTLVDSPGLNGIAEGHKEITEQQILKSHASIFLFNSDHPGSKTDFEFLYELRKRVKTIIFVLNKIDAIKPDEGETVDSVIATLKKNYKKQFPEETDVPEIWPVSAFKALVARNEEPLDYNGTLERTEAEKQKLEEDSGLKRFEDRLLNFLTCGEKAHQQLMAPVERVISVARESLEQYREEEELLHVTPDSAELEDKIAEIREAVDALDKQASEGAAGIVNQVGTALSEIIDELEANIAKFQKRKINEINEMNDLEEVIKYMEGFERNFKQKVLSLALEAEESWRDKLIFMIRARYAGESAKLTEKINAGDSVIKLEVQNHLDTEVGIFEVGLKEMEEKTKAIEAEMKQLREEANKAQENAIRARALQKKRERLERELTDLRDSREMIELQMLPPVERYLEDVPGKQGRGGILGGLWFVLFGRKNVTRQEWREDSSAHNEAKRAKDKKLAGLEAEMSERKKELTQLEDVDAGVAADRQLQKQSELEEVRERLTALQKESAEKIEAAYQKEIKRLRRKLTEYCDELTDDLVRQVKKELRASESGYANGIAEVVTANIREAMRQKQEYIKALQGRINASEEGRNERIEELHRKVEQVEQLIFLAVDLETELESEKIDVIEKVAI